MRTRRLPPYVNGPKTIIAVIKGDKKLSRLETLKRKRTPTTSRSLRSHLQCCPLRHPMRFGGSGPLAVRYFSEQTLVRLRSLDASAPQRGRWADSQGWMMKITCLSAVAEAFLCSTTRRRTEPKDGIPQCKKELLGKGRINHVFRGEFV